MLTDLDYTSTGYADMVAACRATKVPVLQRDWFLHPLQVGMHTSCALTEGLTVPIIRVSLRKCIWHRGLT